MTEKRTCPIDGAEMEPVFKAVILGRHDVQYYACSECSFLQTEDPYWLEDAYSDVIADCDTGIMERNLHNVFRITAVLRFLGLHNETIIDVAGGYGILTRLLRDAGFDCLWSDKYCNNIMAKGFQALESSPAYVLCAMEVLEHVENPFEFMKNAIAQHDAKVMLFSTEELESLPDENWWYYSRETGQHISFYSVKSLEGLARRLGWKYTRLPRHLHLFTAYSLGRMKRAVLRRMLYLYAFMALPLMRRHSKTHSDCTLLDEGKE